MYDRTDRIAREDQALATLDHHARRAREAGKTARTGALLVVVLILAAVWVGFMVPPPSAHSAPRPAAASPVKGEVDVCTTGLSKSWTRTLERKANRQLQQRIDVHRRSEDHLRGCDVVVWQGGRVAYDYTTDQPAANPRYAVMVRTPYNLMAAVEINVGSITPKAQRPQTIIDALRTAGIR